MLNGKEKLISETLALVSALSSYFGYTLEETYYLSKEKIMSISISLICEICDLIDKGYTYEEIEALITNAKFEDLDLSSDEIAFLRRDAKKTLKIKFEKEK